MNLVDIGNGFQLDQPAAEAFLRMSEAAKADGVIFHVDTAYRSFEFQTKLYKQFLADQKAGKHPSPVAVPGHSKHELGLAVDIAVSKYPATLKWLNARAREFGFYPTVKTENWHWEFRG